MVGALNKLPVAASGMIFFGDPVTFHSVIAIMLGFVAGLVYSVGKPIDALQIPWTARSHKGMTLLRS